MRKTNLLGATFLALATAAMPLTAFAQAAAPAAAPAPAATPAPAPAPEPTPAPAPDAAPAAPAPDASAPAPAASDAKPMKKPMHHKMAHAKGKLAPTKAGDKAVEDLNAASLDSAKSGKPFMAPTTPEAAKKEAHTGTKTSMHKKMHHMTKKTSDAAAQASDASAPPPADTTAPK